MLYGLRTWGIILKCKVVAYGWYPAIIKQAQKEDAVIFFGDETAINNQAYHVSGFAPKGQPPAIASFSKREKINMILAISNQGTCHFLCYDENMIQQCFIDFMERLIKDTDWKVFL